MQGLDEAIDLHQQTLVLRPPGHPDRSCSLNSLASAIHMRFKHAGVAEDLDEAIDLYRQVLALRSLGHPDRGYSSSSLALVSVRGSNKLGGEAIDLYRQAPMLSPPGHPDHSSCLKNVALTVLTRFKKFGIAKDLKVILELHRKTLKLSSGGSNNLGQ